ncbi:hypothetical protein [Haloarcula halophila]|uniref:hypothetical protein n=1 Tax=Haloarcula TaxID=2237 RepID=UPI0023E46F6B|nr:hypothetical protein [Halomicroarcula sp. DFY41]
MSSLQNALRTATAALIAAMAWTRDALQSVYRTVRRVVVRCVRVGQGQTVAAWETMTRLLRGPGRRFVTGPVRVFLLGRRTDVSLLVLLIAPVLALASAWWVGSTVGYETLAALTRGTWTGTNPSMAIFIAASGLLLLGGISAGINSGLLPTYGLVSAPIFGAAVTRYGTTVTYSWGTEVVSLPDAVGIGLLIAFSLGLPLALGGFVLGRLLRRVVTVLGGRSGPTSPVDHS